MKLGQIPDKDPIKRQPLPLHESTWTQLEQYRELYSRSYGKEIKLGPLVEKILQEFMAADKEFREYLKTNGNGSAKPTR
jgi:hypothetical protein